MAKIIPNRPNFQPFSTKWVLRIAIVLIIVLSLWAGYYADLAKSRQRKIQRLEKQLHASPSPTNPSTSTTIKKTP